MPKTTIIDLGSDCIKKSVFLSHPILGALENAELAPVFERFDNMNKSNLRYIDIAPRVAKIFERLYNDKLVECLL